MPELTKRARHLVQLLAEELDRTGAEWNVLMSGDGEVGSPVWDWRVDFSVDGQASDWYVSNPETNVAEVIPINRVKR